MENQRSHSSQREEAPLIENRQQCREDSSTTFTLADTGERTDLTRHATTAIFFLFFVVTLVVGGVFYHNGKQEAYPAIFSSALCVFSVILGAFLTRLILVFTEMSRLDDRYSSSRRKIFLACFSGVQWWAVFLVLILAALIIGCYIQSVRPKFQWEYITLVLSSVGLGPFISLALQLDKLTPFQKDKIVEEKKTTVTDVLAWSYYYLYLDNIQHVWDINKYIGLNLKKIFILIPQDCNVLKDDIYDDSRFQKIEEFKYEKGGDFAGFVDKVCVKVGDNERYIAVHRALPLHCILQMSRSKMTPIVENMEQEAKLFYEKIKTIMVHELSKSAHDKYHLVCYKNRDDLMQKINTAIQEHIPSTTHITEESSLHQDSQAGTSSNSNLGSGGTDAV